MMIHNHENYQSVLANAYRIYPVYLSSSKSKFISWLYNGVHGNILEEPINSDALLLTPVSKNRLYIPKELLHIRISAFYPILEGYLLELSQLR
jgi:hypothetical protein